MHRRQRSNRADRRLRAEAAALDLYLEALFRGERPPVVSPPIDVRMLILAVQLRVAGERAMEPDPAFMHRLMQRLQDDLAQLR